MNPLVKVSASVLRGKGVEAETDFGMVHGRCASDVALHAKRGTSVRVEGEARAQTRSGESGPECLKTGSRSSWKELSKRGKGPKQELEKEVVQAQIRCDCGKWQGHTRV